MHLTIIKWHTVSSSQWLIKNITTKMDEVGGGWGHNKFKKINQI